MTLLLVCATVALVWGAALVLMPRRFALRTTLRRELRKKGIGPEHVSDGCLSEIADMILRYDLQRSPQSFGARAQRHAEAFKGNVSLIAGYLHKRFPEPAPGEPIFETLQKHMATSPRLEKAST